MPIPQKAPFLIILLSLVLGVLVLHPAVGLAQQAGERVLARNLTDAKFAERRRLQGLSPEYQALFSLAGFQVTIIGRIWVTPEAKIFQGHVSGG